MCGARPRLPNPKRSTPGSYRQLLMQTLRKAPQAPSSI